MSTLGCLINNVMYTNFVCSNRKLLKYITSLLLWIQKIWSRTNYKIFSIDLRRKQVNFLVYGQHSKKKKKKRGEKCPRKKKKKKKKKEGWSVGEIKIILFNSYGRYFFENNILHSKRRRKTHNFIIYYNKDKL